MKCKHFHNVEEVMEFQPIRTCFTFSQALTTSLNVVEHRSLKNYLQNVVELQTVKYGLWYLFEYLDILKCRP